jgi:hypothetical protein
VTTNVVRGWIARGVVCADRESYGP